ncbi:hypothetical protein [Mariprofundus ferrooxydans]|uniref:hypothetical protein n=1 Tax=Mariprofundus ferrooxydans TaxID=314344 RepID=UPI0012DF748B|nr:hypothetical protein [Mariprofundus ferrooxydans]
MKQMDLLRITVLLLPIMLAFASHSYAASENDIRWKESQGMIVHSSVCYNHIYGSVEYRGCRSNAKNLFKEKCAQYQKMGSSAKGLKDKFCFSARNYNPVR